MLTLLFAAAVVGQSSSATEPLALSAAERIPAVVVVLTPFGSGTAAGTSRFIDAMATALHTHTDLRGLSAEQAGIDFRRLVACPARRQLTCWTEVATRRTKPGAIPPRFLFSLAVRRIDDGEDRVSISMLDTSLSAQLPAGMESDAREDAIFRRTPRSRPLKIKNDDQLAAAIERLVTDHFAEPLTRVGHWRPFGSVIVQSSCDGCEVLVDTKLVGLSRPGPLRVDGLRAGSATLTLRKGTSVLLRCPTDVATGRTTAIPLRDCEQTPARPAGDERLWFRYGGVATGIAGLTLITLGAVRASNAPTAICLVPAGRSDDGCAALGAPGFGFSADVGITTNASDVDPSAVPMAAVGAGLLGLGVSWMTTSWLAEDWPWWAHLLTGLAVGGLATGLGIGLGSGS